MKKLLFVLLVCAAVLSIQSIEAKYRGCRRPCRTEYECGPIPCCERQELITVRKPAEMICGYICPPGTCEVGAEEEGPCCG